MPENHRHPRDRYRAIDWAKSVVKTNKDWVVLDTESNGIGESATVLHIAILSNKGEVLMDQIIRPKTRAKVDQEIIVGLGLNSRKELNAAPTLEDVGEQFVKALQGKNVITYNAEFRQRILEQSGVEFSGHMNCAMKPFAAFIGEWHSGKQDYKFQKLPKPKKRWNALDDCKATYDLIHFMAEFQKPKPWWQLW